MSVTSKLAFNRSMAAQPAGNLYGPGAAVAMGGSNSANGPQPASITGAVRGAADAQAIPGASFMQVILGVAIMIALAFGLTWSLHRLYPLKEQPEFLRDFIHTLPTAISVAVWFILIKMSAGVPPMNNVEPYKTIAGAL